MLKIFKTPTQPYGTNVNREPGTICNLKTYALYLHYINIKIMQNKGFEVSYKLNNRRLSYGFKY